MALAPEVRGDLPLRVGIFGGTFDPPHLGHVSGAREVADALALDEVLWIPARRSPLKPNEPLTDVEVRLEMARAAVDSEAAFRVHDLEIDRPGPSFTVDTLRELRGEVHPDTELFLIIGMDQYRALDAWRKPDEIARIATIVVMDRKGEGLSATVGDEVPRRIPVARVDVSSTEVRTRVGRGESVAGMVSPAVLAIMARERLYENA
jgi:nicotinate-nucleotide adenylyltransferase